MAFIPFVPSALVIRRNLIIKKLKAVNANSEDTAVTFAEAGVFNSDAFPRITERMIQQGILAKTADGKYFLL